MEGKLIDGDMETPHDIVIDRLMCFGTESLLNPDKQVIWTVLLFASQYSFTK